MPDKPIVFQDKTIRRTLVNGEWFFSVVDVVAALTDSMAPGAYWRKLKQRLTAEGSQVVTFCHELKLPAADGKNYKTDCANVKGMFRIIQSIPSPKAEPFKQWLAQVGYDRVLEIENPELAQERMKELYEQKGYSKDWIRERPPGDGKRVGALRHKRRKLSAPQRTPRLDRKRRKPPADQAEKTEGK